MVCKKYLIWIRLNSQKCNISNQTMGCSDSRPQPVRRREQRKAEFDFESRERRHRTRKGHPEDDPDLRFKIDPVILDGPPQTYRSELSDDKVKHWKVYCFLFIQYLWTRRLDVVGQNSNFNFRIRVLCRY